MSAWGGRTSVNYVVAALVLIITLALSSTLWAIVEYRSFALGTIEAAKNDAVRILAQQDAAHRSLGEARAITWNYPLYRLTVFDDRGRPVFDSAPPGASAAIGNAAEALFSMPRAEAALPGGHLVVSTNPSLLVEWMRVALFATAPAMLVAVVVTFILARLIVAQTRRQALARTLQSIHDADFTQQPIVTSATPEIAAITEAYNTFALNLQQTVAEREKIADGVRDFVSDASHQLKTPLTIIMGYLDPVVNGLIIDVEQQRQILGKIVAECRRMRDTIEKLAALARLDRGPEENARVVDAEAVVREIVGAMNPIAPNVHLDVSTDGVARVVMDDRSLRDAITNVIENAVKYAPSSPIDVRLTTAEDCVVVEVADSGPGMSREDRLRAFDRFHRGTASTKVAGSGLGLAIVKKTIERASGRVALASEVGRGTTVTMYIPRAPVEVTTAR